jgi:hypothetical protein
MRVDAHRVKSQVQSRSFRSLLSACVGVCVLGGVASGCRFGEARFETSFDDVGFDPGGTVFSYVDARDAALAEDTDPPVAVAMTWIVFDAAGDLSDFDGASLFAMAHEMSQRDALALIFERQGALNPGETFSVTKLGDEVVEGGGVDFALHLTPERLDASSTYSEIRPFGSRQTLEVTLDAVSFDDADAGLSGTVELTFEGVEGTDIGAARKGSFTGTFRAPLVAEPTAEKNLALLQKNVPVLPLPLAGRGAP